MQAGRATGLPRVHGAGTLRPHEEPPMSNDNVIALAAHQAALREQADEIIGLAMQLRSKLKTSCSVPIPDRETDALIIALTTFVTASKRT